MSECSECGGPLAGDEEICPACGASIPEVVPETPPGPGPDEAEAAVPSVTPEAAAGNGGKRCPECGTVNPVEAQFCVQCRHAFAGRVPFLGAGWLAIPALIAVILIVAAVAAFSFGFIGTKPDTTVANKTAQSGANGTAKEVLNQSRNVTPNATAALNATLNATPTRMVDPNATPWNAQIGAGINHTEGGTHYVGLSQELGQKRQDARATPTPISPFGVGTGSGHATGPYSWVGIGDWSPGFIDLPAGDAQVVLMSQGTSAFVLVDGAGTYAGYGAFPPPGGTYTVPIPAAGRYVIAFGTANATDAWSATVLLPGSGSGGRAVVPPVPTPATQLFTFAGTGGGSSGSFNLTPGSVHVQLSADQMTMAYLRDAWGVTLSTTVAGPSDGGTTVAISRAGTYHLETWGTGTWTAVVTWTGTPGAAATVPTVNPANVVPTLTPMYSNTTGATATGTKVAPVIIATTATTTAPTLPFGSLPTGPSGTGGDSGGKAVPPITITSGN